MPPPGRLLLASLIVVVAFEIQAQRHRAAPSTSDRFCDFGTDVAGVSVPPDFCLRKFADVPTPRVILFAPNGDLLVASPKRTTPGAAPPGAGAIFLNGTSVPGVFLEDRFNTRNQFYGGQVGAQGEFR